MMTTRSKIFTVAAVCAVAVGSVYMLTDDRSGAAFAADQTTGPVTAPANNAAPGTTPAPNGVFLGLTDIESQLTAQGIRVTEMEVHDKVLEVDGVDAQGRKIDLIVDRRNGEILSRKLDD